MTTASATHRVRVFWRRWRREAGLVPETVYAVPISAESSRVSRQVCARCAREATRFSKCRWRAFELLVPLCDPCDHALDRQATRVLGVALSAAVFGTTVALTLPLLWTAGAVLQLLGCVLLASLVPYAVDVALRRRVPAGAVCHGAPVTSRHGRWCCRDEAFAELLAAGSAVRPERARMRVPPWPSWAVVGIVPALLASVAVQSQRPIVRFVNVSGDRLEVSVDGRAVANLAPTGSESPNAGAAVRVAVGRRHFQARNMEGKLVADATVEVESGRHHLYAPQSDGYCFWLERSHYGRGVSGSVEAVQRASQDAFWVIPYPVDTWFAANPPTVHPDPRSSGGVLTALRQARCEDRARENVP